MNIYIIQTIIMVILAIIIFYLIIYNNSLKLEKRISKYSIDSIKDNSISLFDLLYNEYSKMVGRMTKILKKSAVLNKYLLNIISILLMKMIRIPFPWILLVTKYSFAYFLCL